MLIGAFDYDGKYLGKGSVEITPAEISPELTLACQNVAKKVHIAIGAFGYSRTDIILDSQGPVFFRNQHFAGSNSRVIYSATTQRGEY